MTSTVTQYSSLIDETFPIAGQANDTQGFRDNFAAIKNAFTSTSNEINNLQIQINTIASTSSIFAANIASTVTTQVWSSLSNILSTSSAVSYRLAAPVSSTGAPGDLKGMIYANSTTLYVCYETWVQPGTDHIWTKITTTDW
jgi:hypothetical protein